MSVNMARSRVANAVKASRAEGVHPDTVPRVLEAKRDLAAEKLKAYINRIVDDAPPLSPAQRAHLASLFTRR